MTNRYRSRIFGRILQFSFLSRSCNSQRKFLDQNKKCLIRKRSPLVVHIPINQKRRKAIHKIHKTQNSEIKITISSIIGNKQKTSKFVSRSLFWMSNSKLLKRGTPPDEMVLVVNSSGIRPCSSPILWFHSVNPFRPLLHNAAEEKSSEFQGQKKNSSAGGKQKKSSKTVSLTSGADSEIKTY